MGQSTINSSRDESEKKYFYCDTCSSLLPAPGFYCVQCEPPSAPNSIIEDELTFSQAMLRISLLVLLFLVIAIFKLDINIVDELIYNQKDTKLKIADEMTGNLDEKNSNEIFEFFINKIKKNNQTVIYVTHNIKFANMARVKYKLEKGSLNRYNTY